MSVLSKETALSSDDLRSSSKIDGTVQPSKVAQPTRSDSFPQQGNTQPGSGSVVRDTTDKVPRELADGESNRSNIQAPFKERVFGAALKTRGTLLKKPQVKETGQQLLDGKIDIPEARTNVN
ncbi:uncharacterized protein BT62DRAFT_1025031 [Guyanagaster necrorhizus]|uniref:Uncharacterized protein n=1 Tax=Guyanagaster necrorhizus TaxID=856835 RepID=A0A9P7VQR8_9AGAR|nr:uncharacterized protein BT62DRAFT_1025031 [Guyanagaster necrorhizus MCA 3950]KAG7445708.1 hypothetical protein BT62DRAFT_1025031 [Guyanagaster necrorhizus MCA 3950]